MAAAPSPSIPIAARFQIPGVYDNTGKKAKRPRGEEGDPDRPSKKAPQQAKSAPQAAPEAQLRLHRHRLNRLPLRRHRAAPLLQPLQPRFEGRAVDRDGGRCAGGCACASTARCPSSRSGARRRLLPLPRQRHPPPQQKQAAAPATSTLPSANSPLGVWLTEEKEGKVRIEQCGANLCGYSVDKKSNQNGEQVLINMKPGKDKWSGRIFDPNTGSTYDFDDRPEGHRQPARSGLRLRRHVLRRPDLDPRQLTQALVMSSNGSALNAGPFAEIAGLFSRVMTVTVVLEAAVRR